MKWYSGSIPDAVAEVKSCQKVLLVFVVGEDELSKNMSSTYEDSAVSERLSSNNCVALKLTVNSVPYEQFIQIYPVVVIPSSFFIGKNGLPIEIITGSLTPEEFVEKIDKIFQLNEGSASQSTTSQSSEPMDLTEGSASASVHNGCGNSNIPSTSKDETLVLQSGSSQAAGESAPLDDRVERAKALIETRRQTKAIEEQEEWVSSGKKCLSAQPIAESERKRMKVEATQELSKEKRDEQERRKLGKALQQAQQSREENEIKEWAQNRAKEKEEERLARERVRAQIAQDRAERAARYQQVKAEEAAVQKERETNRLKEEQERAVRDAAMRSTMARVQFRLPDGTSVTHQFSADSTLGEARNFVIEEIRPSFSNFTLCMTFPRRHFTEADYAETLRDLQLAPSAAVLVLPGQAVAVTNSEGSFFGNIFWMLVSPLLAVWRAISSIFGRSSPESENQAPESEPGPSGVQASSSSKKSAIPNDGPVADGQAQGARRRTPQKFYKEGNVFRINNRPTDDDDDNNTWNGNSTQQM